VSVSNVGKNGGGQNMRGGQLLKMGLKN